MYHQGFEVASLETAIQDLRKQGALVASPPKPAVAFGGRRVAFLVFPTGMPFELIESAAAAT